MDELPSDGSGMAGSNDFGNSPLESFEIVTGHLLQRHAAGAPLNSILRHKTSYKWAVENTLDEDPRQDHIQIRP